MRNSLISTRLPKSFIQPQQKLVLKVLWIKACPFGSENQSCSAKKPFAFCWGRLLGKISGHPWYHLSIPGRNLAACSLLNISLLDWGKDSFQEWGVSLGCTVGWSLAFNQVQASGTQNHIKDFFFFHKISALLGKNCYLLNVKWMWLSTVTVWQLPNMLWIIQIPKFSPVSY